MESCSGSEKFFKNCPYSIFLMNSPPQKKTSLQNISAPPSPPLKNLNTPPSTTTHTKFNLPNPPPPRHHHTHKIQHPPALIQTQLLKYILILLQRKLNPAPILSVIYAPLPPHKNININLIFWKCLYSQ